MSAMSSHARMSLTLDLSWSNNGIAHQERLFIDRLNPWRDLFPGSFLEKVIHRVCNPESGPDRSGADTGMDPFLFELAPGQLLPDRDPGRVLELDQGRLDSAMPFERIRPGRFYPQGLIRGVPGIFKGNLIPFRCLEKEGRRILADLNHPLAGLPLTLKVSPPVFHTRKVERGGSCTDWMDLFLAGPGMQNPAAGTAPDFFSGSPFDRQDRADDTQFYRTDRFVHHMDDTARQALSRWYQNRLKPGDRILDLMAGWESHLPEPGRFGQVHGLGLNANELAANPGLTGFSVQDLNRNPSLAFGEAGFDAVICSLSVEYLTDPLAVFREAARVLRPGGLLAVAFSNRWFPEKTIALWPELHEFERMGFVLDLFKRTGLFDRQSTFSLRGLPRPETDRYFPELRLADPLFTVAGHRKP